MVALIVLIIYTFTNRVNGAIVVEEPIIPIDNETIVKTVCIGYPSEANGDMADVNWQDTIATLFATKGYPKGTVSFFEYDDVINFARFNTMDCSYNLLLTYLVGTDDPSNMDLIVDLFLNRYACQDMNVTLYYYAQMDRDDDWMVTGSSCSVKVCPLNVQTLGIGCNTADVGTFEEVVGAKNVAMIDVVDGVQHKVSVTGTNCKIQRCKKIEEKWNNIIINAGKWYDADTTLDPMTDLKNVRSLRLSINWRKWWAIFYRVVDYINDIIQIASPSRKYIDDIYLLHR